MTKGSQIHDDDTYRAAGMKRSRTGIKKAPSSVLAVIGRGGQAALQSTFEVAICDLKCKVPIWHLKEVLDEVLSDDIVSA